MATKKDLQDKISTLENEKVSIIERTMGNHGCGIECKNWSKMSVKALKEYHDSLKLAIEEELVKIYQENEDLKGTINPDLKEIMDKPLIEDLKEINKVLETETLTYMPEGQVMIDSRNPETRLIQCAIDNDLFSGTLWSQTGNVINGERAKFDISDKKVMAQEFSSMLDSRVDPAMIPEQGPDRSGDIITLRKKSGAVKWSSWQITSRLVQNCSNIFKGIEVLGYSTVFPRGEIIPRSQLDKLLGEIDSDKPKEEAFKTVQRCLEQSTKKLVEIENIEELVSCNDFIETFMETFRERLQLLKVGAKEKEKAEA